MGGGWEEDRRDFRPNVLYLVTVSKEGKVRGLVWRVGAHGAQQ